MMKIVIGLATAIVVAVGGYFGFTFYAQHRAVSEVDAAFERIRNAGGKASHGDVTFDVWKHTLTIKDIASETATQPPTSIKLASVTAYGVAEAGPGRVSADQVDATDVEANFALGTGGSQLQYSYKLPKLTVMNYVGPAQMDGPPSGASALDMYQFAITRVAQIAASEVTAPQLSVGVKLSSTVQSTGDINYSGLSIEGIKDGKIAAAKIDKGDVAYTNEIAGKSQSFTGTFNKLVFDGFDLGAMAAIFDPKSTDDTLHQVYRRVTLDSYDIKSPPAVHINLAHLLIDDFGVQPSRLQLPALIAALPQAGVTPSPAQGRAMMEKIANLYEGVHLGNFEIGGVTIDTPQGPAKLATFRFNMDHGKSDIVAEGLDAHTPQGPLTAGHLALRGIDLVKSMRLSATIAPGQKPPPEQALALFQLVQGAEVKDLVAPSKEVNKPINVENFNINWGGFIGPIPTQTHLVAKMNVPLSPTDPRVRDLVAAGVQAARIDADLGLGWTETSSTLALEPATLQLDGLAKAQLRFALLNVPRTLFAEPQKGAMMLAQVNTGAIEFTLHDLGGVDLLVNQYARSHNLAPDAARTAVHDSLKSEGAPAENANPDASASVDAISSFVDKPQQTLTIKLTPIGTLPALQLVQLLKSDPMAALAQFKIEASTGP